MDTIKETAGKAKDWVVEHRWDIASAVVALGMGCVCGKMIRVNFMLYYEKIHILRRIQL